MRDPIDQEVDQLCGEIYNHVEAEYDYQQEKPLGPLIGLRNALIIMGFAVFVVFLICGCKP